VHLFERLPEFQTFQLLKFDETPLIKDLFDATHLEESAIESHRPSQFSIDPLNDEPQLPEPVRRYLLASEVVTCFNAAKLI
jgi:hypothetical protein